MTSKQSMFEEEATMKDDNDDVLVPSKGAHVHFDCFSGAAGDMLLAACLDAAAPDSMELLAQVKRGLSTIPEICNEFDCHMERVIRGHGCIAANKVHVSSIYQHHPTPILTTSTTTKLSKDSSSLQKQHKNTNLTTPVDVKDIPTPEWKRKALVLQQDKSSDNPPFGGSWTVETSINILQDTTYERSIFSDDKSITRSQQNASPTTSAMQKVKEVSPADSTASTISGHSHSHSHSHGHDHFHSHDHGHQHSHDHSHPNHTNTIGPLRNLSQITLLIKKSKLPLRVKELSIATFRELARAEAFTHGMPTLDHVHFHEVGAIDSIVDTVGTILALHLLNVSSVTCSRLPLGEGTVMTAHGLLPVPAPATLRLLM